MVQLVFGAGTVSRGACFLVARMSARLLCTSNIVRAFTGFLIGHMLK